MSGQKVKLKKKKKKQPSPRLICATYTIPSSIWMTKSLGDYCKTICKTAHIDSQVKSDLKTRLKKAVLSILYLFYTITDSLFLHTKSASVPIAPGHWTNAVLIHTMDSDTREKDLCYNNWNCHELQLPCWLGWCESLFTSYKLMIGSEGATLALQKSTLYFNMTFMSLLYNISGYN